MTDYKDHMGTNLSPKAQLYVMKGEERYSHMSQCVGVGCWVLTKDSYLVMVENAGWKGEQACREGCLFLFLGRLNM